MTDPVRDRLAAAMDGPVLAGRRARRAARCHSVADLRRAARRRLPPMVFDFVDGGAEDEVTLEANRAAFGALWFRPRILADVSRRSLDVELWERPLPMPVVLAPAGLAGLVWPAGEVAAARVAGRAGVPFVVSTASSCSIEDVRAATDGPLWFQLYLWRDREVTGTLVDRAAAAGYDALCLTVDVPLSGVRLRDVRNGMTIPPRIGLKNALGVLSRPGWVVRSAAAPVVTFANVSGGRPGRTTALGTYVNSQLNPAASWDDLRWLRDRWKGRLLVKGVLDPAAAARLVAEGVDGIVVSNHGGRQLDAAVPAVAALADVVAAVDGRVPVLMDGGVRHGADVVKALALGARACLVGRPYLWGLAAAGPEGVGRVLALLEAEVDRTLALVGVADASALAAAGTEILKKTGRI
ncbi:MAG TPA: alpha-hydroxy acid oxidase [Acidimicrobiales bacterium]|nr:alpha-hydroxy acid oxidase [Acidimicrobiales bacterium]